MQDQWWYTWFCTHCRLRWAGNGSCVSRYHKLLSLHMMLVRVIGFDHWSMCCSATKPPIDSMWWCKMSHTDNVMLLLHNLPLCPACLYQFPVFAKWPTKLMSGKIHLRVWIRNHDIYLSLLQWSLHFHIRLQKLYNFCMCCLPHTTMWADE